MYKRQPQPDAATAESAPAVAPQQEIQQLLVDAQQQMANRKFISPPSGNALQSYQRVLELEPTNPVATEGIQRISTYYQDIAKQSLQQGRIDGGLADINRGLRATPKSATLLALRREARLAKQRQEEQRQAVLLEERRQQETADLVRRRQEDLIQPTQTQQPNQTQPAQQPAQPNREIRVIPRQSLPRPPQAWGPVSYTQLDVYKRQDYTQQSFLAQGAQCSAEVATPTRSRSARCTFRATR